MVFPKYRSYLNPPFSTSTCHITSKTKYSYSQCFLWKTVSHVFKIIFGSLLLYRKKFTCKKKLPNRKKHLKLPGDATTKMLKFIHGPVLEKIYCSSLHKFKSGKPKNVGYYGCKSWFTKHHITE